MLKIAITGNIASGKSQVEKILEDLNYTVLDTDKINNDLLLNDEETKQEIKETFKNYNIEENNTISKTKLGDIVFNNKKEKEKLENILHKRILEKIENYTKNNKNKDFIFISVPLLFEVGWEKYFDKIVFVSADEKTRLERLIKRNNLTKEQAMARITAQDKEEYKIDKSDYVIYNNSDLTTLKLETNKFLSKIINL